MQEKKRSFLPEFWACGGLLFGDLQDIENLDDLTALEELWLGKNKITEIKVGSVLLIILRSICADFEFRIYHHSST
jgi:Leucine-rich repeat (LRR) protein